MDKYNRIEFSASRQIMLLVITAVFHGRAFVYYINETEKYAEIHRWVVSDK